MFQPETMEPVARAKGALAEAKSKGFDTVVRDVSEPLLQRGRTGIQKSLGRLAERFARALAGEIRGAEAMLNALPAVQPRRV